MKKLFGSSDKRTWNQEEYDGRDYDWDSAEEDFADDSMEEEAYFYEEEEAIERDGGWTEDAMEEDAYHYEMNRKCYE